MDDDVCFSSNKFERLRIIVFEKILKSLKNTYNMLPISENDIKLLIERDEIDYLSDL
ncbi:hypothetical protein AAJ76_800008942 [Vairimorpha ceranae]|uniref:Uncharacterized protein n=1 Tax=Vairimorpha ceranae TaxID=40302 RepID=A0A0F9Z977_9MICR|nr:hypothetical protein AAJ76_800008942 [Vairimorpha ceranae]KKO74354.1 hypothetical protein AAJ76_800008942 [Vairimorpha ceranae]